MKKNLGKKTSGNKNEALEEQENNKNKKVKISEGEKTNKQNTNQQNTTKSFEETDKYSKFKKIKFQCDEQKIINEIYTNEIKNKKGIWEKFRSDFLEQIGHINDAINKFKGDEIKDGDKIKGDEIKDGDKSKGDDFNNLVESIYQYFIQIPNLKKNENKKNLEQIKKLKTKEQLAQKVNDIVKTKMEIINNKLKEYEEKINLLTDHNAVVFKKFEIKDDNKIHCSFERIDKDKMMVAKLDKEQLLKNKKIVGKIDEKKIEIDEAEWNSKFKKIDFQDKEQEIINGLYEKISKKITEKDKKKYEDLQSLIAELFNKNMEEIKNMNGEMEVIKDYLYENFLEKIENEEYDEYKKNLMEAIKKSNNKEELEKNIKQWLDNTNNKLNNKITEYNDKLNNFFKDHNAVVFDNFEIKDNKICCSFKTIDKDKIINAEIDIDQLNKNKMVGKCKLQDLMEINEFEKCDISLEGDLLNAETRGVKKELRYKNGKIILYDKKQNSKCFTEKKFSATDRDGSPDKTDCSVTERTDDKIKIKHFLSAKKNEDGTCNVLSNKYSYIETNTDGFIKVPEVKPIADDKKVILYSLLEKKDLAMIDRFKKKYKDKLQVIICEEKKEDKENVGKDNKKGDNEKELIFKYDVSHLRIKPEQKKLDILLLKHGAYMKDGMYNLNLDVIVNDIKKALEDNQQIEQIYIKNYSCYNGLIQNNEYKIVNELEKMFQDLIQRKKINTNTKIVLSNARFNDLKQIVTTIDEEGRYGLKSLHPHVLVGNESEVNMLTENTRKNNKNSKKGPEYRILKRSRDGSKCWFDSITYRDFCEKFQRGTYQRKDHAPGYYNNLAQTNTNQAKTQLPNNNNSMSKNG